LKIELTMSLLQNIVYISGSGRSGSTLLERILHSSPDVSALGEFHCLWRLHEDEITCSCATPFAVDPFWQPVLKQAGIDAAAISELRALESQVCRTSFIARHRFDMTALANHPDVKRFIDLQMEIFECVADASGSPVLIDSSKAGPRAWLLSSHPKVRIIHLYRDPADVIASWRSAKYDPGMGRAMKRMSVRAAALDWWKVEHLIRRLERAKPVFRIDYAALCASPKNVLGTALSALALETAVQPQWIDEISVHQGDGYHSLNGNPDRFDKGPIHISKRLANWSKISQYEQLTIKAVASAMRALWPNHKT
jgi:Sulfotransferase family